MARRESVITPFHSFVAQNLVAGAANFGLSPNAVLSQTRLPALADEYAHFRVKEFSFRLHRAAITGNMAAGYVGGVQDTVPATQAQIGELLPSCILPPGNSVPTEWVRVPKQDLAGPLPWYKSVVGAADATEEAPGIICVVVTGTDPILMECRGVFEFKTAVATGNTPLLLEARLKSLEAKKTAQVQRERERILETLGVAPSALVLGRGQGK